MRHRMLVAAAAMVAFALLAPAPTGRGATELSLILPRVASPGDAILVDLEDQCATQAGGVAQVTFAWSLLVSPAATDLVSAEAEVTSAGDLRLTVPDLAAGPYAVTFSCGGESFGVSSNAAGPPFYVLARLPAGAAFDAYLFAPCNLDLPAALGPGLRVLAGPTTTATGPEDPTLVPLTIRNRAEAGDDEGIYARLEAPDGPPGPRHLYTACAGTFRFQGEFDGLAILEVVAAPDSSTAPASPIAPLALIAGAVLGAILGWRRGARGGRARA